MKSHKGSNLVTQTAATHKDSETAVTQEQKTTITHEEEKIALILTLTGIFTIGTCFNKIYSLKYSTHTESLFKFRDLKTRICGCHRSQECFLFFGLF